MSDRLAIAWVNSTMTLNEFIAHCKSIQRTDGIMNNKSKRIGKSLITRILRSALNMGHMGVDALTLLFQPRYKQVPAKDFTPKHRGSVQGNSQYHSKTNKISRKKRGY
jgi:hypothetical protein